VAQIQYELFLVGEATPTLLRTGKISKKEAWELVIRSSGLAFRDSKHLNAFF
jgi:hypothetical protein